ncbi:MAG: hypothetical protein Q8P92_00335 [Candidatus Daviesbacteria bacterium]|nr:hypothetical protein [Candidatus Daviesbacteria bacterium]
MEAPRALGEAVSNGNRTSTIRLPETTVINQVEESQVQALERFVNGAISPSVHKLDLNSPELRRSLLDFRRTILPNGTSWDLGWTLGYCCPIDLNPGKVKIDVTLTTRGRNEVDNYTLNIYGLDEIKGEYFKPVSSKNLFKASFDFFNLPPNLHWLPPKKPGDDGIIILEASGTDLDGNTVKYTINSAGVAQLIVTR